MFFFEIWLFLTFVNAIPYVSFSPEQQRKVTDNLGWYSIFYFTVPGTSLLYHKVIETWNPKYGERNMISKVCHNTIGMFKINKLIAENNEVIIEQVLSQPFSKLNYITHEIIPYKIVHIKYRYVSDKLHALVGYKYEQVKGTVADVFEKNANQRFRMTEDELKIMILNNRIESLEKLGE